MVKKLNRAEIVKSAECTRSKDGIFCVESSLLDSLLGAASTEGEAWELFFSLLDDHMDAYSEGSLVGYQTAARTLGRKGGSVTSARKANTSRENGKKGGRPRKKLSA